MRLAIPIVLAALASIPFPAQAQRSFDGPGAAERSVEVTGSIGGRAPWSQPWEYDTGSDNDNRPELKPYQQSGGQQTGGPARNLLPDDGIHLVPRR
jgi:hypothetical protein